MEFNDVLVKRASIRKYSVEKVDILDIVECIQAAHHAPSPGNLPILRYLIVENQEKKDQVAEACQQPFVATAPFLVLVLSDIKGAIVMYDKRAKKYVTQHAGASIENFLLKITDLGLVSCWVGAFSERAVRDSLAIPDEIEIEAILPVGYQQKSDHTTQRKKPQLDGKVFFEKYGNKFKRGKEIMRRADI